ncbi:hypothetical protein SAMD00019534_123010 [Acytostelium subglobosum LB1]|uniref:hypothetical protein n=1 Tax=Acytostelium subglobosum LB1 TaxID=1410327 RepID=UPI0006448F74|nr:hypothetical protein SAMD00019534_123010 [Acytostelium subglobosum LB1]GAM29125.1 hypothetical protein SAMD00019534_123010 [Acytostelium subglobosum LB1]|eukprot:XP_012747970.1 hypothetical protein SAMD00019534_123010 [Acytostelium subglobosum LB1]
MANEENHHNNIVDNINSNSNSNNSNSSSSSSNNSNSTNGNTLYQPKSILITGGAGFIGSHLAVHLSRLYSTYHLVVLDKLDYCSNIRNLSQVSSHKFYRGNILDAALLDRIFTSEAIDTVIHLAAHTHVDNSFHNSIIFTENNVLGTHYLLECARRHSIQRFIYVSTDEVYGSPEHQLRKGSVENKSMLLPTNPYAASKAAAEHLVQSYYKSFNLPSIITRGNNVYGPHQYPEKIIPKFINLLLAGEQCTIHGNGQNMRSFLHVDDVVRAFDVVLHKGRVGETYNIGTEFEISNIDVAKTLVELITAGDTSQQQLHKYLSFVPDRPFNDQSYFLNSNKVRQLGWCQQVAWREGLQRTVQWYKDNEHYWDQASDDNDRESQQRV